MLLPVMPNVLDELRDKEDTRRGEAVDLLGKLFSLPHSDACAMYPELFQEFLCRSKDQKACSFTHVQPARLSCYLPRPALGFLGSFSGEQAKSRSCQ